MKKVRVLALLLSLCLLFASTACQSEQDALYSQALDGASSTIQEELPESEGTDESAEFMLTHTIHLSTIWSRGHRRRNCFLWKKTQS